MTPILLLPLVALADVTFHQGSATPTNVRDIQCASDGGIYCTRNGSVSSGTLSCSSATSTERGCVTPTAQTFAGDKTFTGFVKSPTVDAGIVAVGTMDLRGNTITGGSSASLTITSNATDSVTSSSTAAMTFALGADITSSDLGWKFKDSSGNTRMSGTESGTWNFTTVVTDTGAATVAGTTFALTTGSGGASSGVTVGGTGGSVTVQAGTGGDSAGAAFGGNGGAVSITAGPGGADNGAFPGGSGGALTLTGGAGTGGNTAGPASLVAGAGGSSSVDHAASAGGLASVTGGRGGHGAAGGAAQAGGGVTITGGQGGNTLTGSGAGAGGALTIQSGGGGVAGAGTGGSGGAITIDTGSSTGAATAGTVDIGITNAGTITIGRSGQSTVVNGYGVATTHGTTVLAIEKGATAMTSNELAVTFATAFGAAPSCNCTHVNTSNTNACNIKSGSAPTTAGVTFAVASGGTDVVDWICIGTR